MHRTQSGCLPKLLRPAAIVCHNWGQNLCQDDQKTHGNQAAVILTILVPLASMQISACWPEMHIGMHKRSKVWAVPCCPSSQILLCPNRALISCLVRLYGVLKILSFLCVSDLCWPDFFTNWREHRQVLHFLSLVNYWQGFLSSRSEFVGTVSLNDWQLKSLCDAKQTTVWTLTELPLIQVTLSFVFMRTNHFFCFFNAG